MICEGSVITAAREPRGTAVDVARDGNAHPIYRAGFAVTVRLPEVTQEDVKPVEEPADIEAPEAKPCPEPERAETEVAVHEEPVEAAAEAEPQSPNEEQPQAAEEGHGHQEHADEV
jgi:hypothetical protein